MWFCLLGLVCLLFVWFAPCLFCLLLICGVVAVRCVCFVVCFVFSLVCLVVCVACVVVSLDVCLVFMIVDILGV